MRPVLITLVGWVFVLMGFGSLLEYTSGRSGPGGFRPAVLLLLVGAPMAYFGGRELRARITKRLIPDSSEVTGHRSMLKGRFLANLLDLVVSILLPNTKYRKK